LIESMKAEFKLCPENWEGGRGKAKRGLVKNT
jgi:hypothetical protein